MRSTSIIIATKKMKFYIQTAWDTLRVLVKSVEPENLPEKFPALVDYSTQSVSTIKLYEYVICNMNVYILHIVVYILHTVGGGFFFFLVSI